jgi:hypothetical protein
MGNGGSERGPRRTDRAAGVPEGHDCESAPELWFLAPLVAYALSRPIPRRRAPLSPGDRKYLEEIAQKTWAYFDAYVGAEDNFLPPDNVQVRPDVIVAHRTSPTNIGLGLLATLAAYDLEFINDAELVAICSTGTTRARWSHCGPRTSQPSTAGIWRARSSRCRWG